MHLEGQCRYEECIVDAVCQALQLVVINPFPAAAVEQVETSYLRVTKVMFIKPCSASASSATCTWCTTAHQTAGSMPAQHMVVMSAQLSVVVAPVHTVTVTRPTFCLSIWVS